MTATNCATHTCYRCGSVEPENEMHELDLYGSWLCEACYNDTDEICTECGSIFHHGESSYLGEPTEFDGHGFCSEECLEEWRSHNDELRWWSSDSISWHKHGRGDMFFGIELEVDDGVYMTPGELVYSLKKHSGDFLLFKTDGSLSSNGVELVSHPATPHYHMHSAKWKRTLEKCRHAGYTSHDNGRCGLHIHVNRDYLGKGRVMQTAVAVRIMDLFDRFEYQFNVFSRRNNFQYCRKNNVPAKENGLLKRATEKLSDYEDRYVQVNLKNTDTVEIRLWRGTLNYETFAATIQLTAGLIDVCKTKSATWLSNVDWYTLCDTITESAQRLTGCKCKELTNYLSRRGLTSVELPEIRGIA